MKKNYLLSALFSILALGTWATDANTSFETATSVAAGSHSITYGIVVEEGNYVKHWYKHTATEPEYVFIEDPVQTMNESAGTLLTAWPEDPYSESIINASKYDDRTYTGSILYTKLDVGETITFYLAAPNNKSGDDGYGGTIVAENIPSTFNVLSFKASEYPFAISREAAVSLPENTAKYIFPNDGDEETWFKISPNKTGLVTFGALNTETALTAWNITVYDGDNDADGTVYREDESKGYGIYTFTVEAGHTYYLAFSNNKRTQVKWDLEEIQPGQDCRVPQTITAGNNVIKNGTVYYQYTVSKDGYVELKSSGANTEKPSAVIYNECGSEAIDESVATKDGFYLKRQVTAGEKIIIQVVGSQDGTFSLSEVDAKTGWDMDHAREISINQPISFDLAGHAETYWFKFTAPADAYDREYLIKTTDTKDISKRLQAIRLGLSLYNGSPSTALSATDSCVVRLKDNEECYLFCEIKASAFTAGNETSLSYDNPGKY